MFYFGYSTELFFLDERMERFGYLVGCVGLIIYRKSYSFRDLGGSRKDFLIFLE